MSDPKRNLPKWISCEQLAAAGLDLIHGSPLVVRCQSCGAEWHPGVFGRKVSPASLKCANGCNVDKLV
jgi:hypothetical protein